MKRIKECLKENELFFHFIDKQTYGILNEEQQKIIINLELLVVETFLHEYLHWRHPNWKEKKVERETDKRLKRMTVKEMKKYCRFIFRKGVI